MSLAAELMAAGANQQLIAAKLQETHAISAIPTYSASKKSTVKEKIAKEEPKKDDDGGLNVPHEEEKEVSVKVPTIDEILSQNTE